jgi:ribose/xylose/arabinose/galactoside ABC-type transport system permease subunit
VVLIFFEVLLLKTRWGKDLFMVGSNSEAAWQAGIDTEKKVMWTFVVSGFCAAFGGILFAASMNAAVPNYGERGISPLMLVLASTIIGGTVMTGGYGSVIKTAVAVITIESIFNGLIGMGLGFDSQVLAAGVLLGVVVLGEAYALYKQALKRGERPVLMKEAEELKNLRKQKG